LGKNAESKLERANYFDKEAAKLVKRDPDSSRELKVLARAQRKSAIKQMKHRPKRRPADQLVIG